MKRIALAIALAVPAAVGAGDTLDELRARTIAFENHWGVFVRDLLGCGPHETDPANCMPARGVVNYAEYSKARHEAAALFRLKE